MALQAKQSNWFVSHKVRVQEKHKGVFKRGHSLNGLIIVGFLLVFMGLWGVIAIFGPVLVAEASYQARNLIGGATGNYGVWNAFRMPNIIPGFGAPIGAQEIGIVIPKIYVRETVVAEVNPNDKLSYMKALQVGVAHAQGTAMPGEAGLGYYFAHSSGMNVLYPQKKAAFYLLGKLTGGDTVYIYQGANTYVYRVTDAQIVEANDLSFLNYSGGKQRIVLQTCWPIGTSLKRLIVTAERAS